MKTFIILYIAFFIISNSAINMQPKALECYAQEAEEVLQKLDIGRFGFSLPEPQKSALDREYDIFIAKVRPLIDEARNKVDSMDELWLQDVIDKEKILYLIRGINQLELQIAELTIEYRINALQILTPEQRRQVILEDPGPLKR
jgi:hypothetical protein